MLSIPSLTHQNQPEPTRSDDVSQAPEGAPLVNNAEIPAALPLSPSFQRYQRALRNLSFAQHLLIKHNVPGARKAAMHRTVYCHKVRHRHAESIALQLTGDAQQSGALLHGVQTCLNPWACDICARRLGWKRSNDIKAALDWARANDHLPLLLTLTAWHTAQMAFDPFKAAFKGAWDWMTKQRSWKRFKSDFGWTRFIRATEPLASRENGYHYHMHLLIFVPRALAADLTPFEHEGRQLWMNALHRHGLTGIPEIAFHLKAGEHTPSYYLAKMGIEREKRSDSSLAFELSSPATKDDKSGWNTFELLQMARAGDESAERAWLDIVKGMNGDHGLTWSKGFRDELQLLPETEESVIDEYGDDFLEFDDDEFRPVRRTASTRESVANLVKIAAETRDAQTVLEWLDALDPDPVSSLRASEDAVEALRASLGDLVARAQQRLGWFHVNRYLLPALLKSPDPAAELQALIDRYLPPGWLPGVSPDLSVTPASVASATRSVTVTPASVADRDTEELPAISFQPGCD